MSIRCCPIGSLILSAVDLVGTCLPFGSSSTKSMSSWGQCVMPSLNSDSQTGQNILDATTPEKTSEPDIDRTSDSRKPGSGVGSPKEVGTPPLPVAHHSM